MFAIKAVGHDIWAPQSCTDCFVIDDVGLSLNQKINNLQFSFYLNFGVPRSQRRIFNSTTEIRRSLRFVSKETIFKSDGFFATFEQSKKFGRFSRYEVVELSSGTVHALDDVFSKRI